MQKLIFIISSCDVEEEVTKYIKSKKALVTARELAQGIEHNFCLDSGWRPPFKIRKMHACEINYIRKKLHLKMEGEDIPQPIKKFQDLRLPSIVLKKLIEKGIKVPFKIQIQGLPIALAGRDLVGISNTGSGKTLTFILPMIMAAYHEKLKFSLHPGEGPLALVLCPSRELARQNYEQSLVLCTEFTLQRIAHLKCLLSIGGINSKELSENIRHTGICNMVATPGRLKEYLQKKKISFDRCKFVCLDEADRMIDFGFEEEIRYIWSFFNTQRQTLMFSATMPAKILQFAESALVDPITVKVSRAGAANSNIMQQVEYVKSENRLIFLLECLNRTNPPVLIFAGNKADVDHIQSYLCTKGVKIVALHGGKSQDERNSSVMQFKSGKSDVLVATDVLSKGIDFPSIKHVINYDMPKDIDSYVHRIGRTSRGANRGLATTFINKDSCESVLRDLKCLLHEAKQRIPPLLHSLVDQQEMDIGGQLGCIYCSGLGHRVVDCLKLFADKRNEFWKHEGNTYVGMGANM